MAATIGKTSVALNVAWTGLAETVGKLEALADADKATKDLAATVYKRESVVLALAQFLCPVRFGGLRRSGMAHVPEIDGSTVTGKVTFGNSAIDYAWYVHENLYAHHKNGQAKWLETAALAEKQNTIVELVGTVNRWMSMKGQKSRSLGVVR